MMTAQDLIGRTLQGRFVIAEQLGEGGMGMVFRGLDEITMDEVAIKVLLPELAVHDEIVARFYREATAARRVDHESAVRVLGRGREGDLHYLVMELLSGQSLAAVLAETPALPPARAARILVQLCEALAVAHERGVVHRDIKPENIMVAPGGGVLGERVKLLDFGVAKPMPRLPSMPSYEDSFNMDVVTTCGALVGTPEYMAPEQCRGLAVDARTDLYACGVLLYRMMTGRVPFDGTHPLELCQRHIGEAPRPPRAIAPWVAPEIEAIILKALQKSPADRYQSATELRDALLGVVGKIEVETDADTETFSYDDVVPPASEVEPATLLFVKAAEPRTDVAAASVAQPALAEPLAPAAAPRVWRDGRGTVDARRLAFYAVLAACMGGATLALSLSAFLQG